MFISKTSPLPIICSRALALALFLSLFLSLSLGGGEHTPPAAKKKCMFIAGYTPRGCTPRTIPTQQRAVRAGEHQGEW